MAIRKTEAIVLRSRDFRETSLIVSFYTRDFGKINGLVKGIRTRNKKYTSYLQPFTYNEIVFYDKVHGGLCTVSQCDLKDFFPVIREDLQKTAYASYLLELVNETSPEQDKNIDLFNLLLTSLRLFSFEDIKKITHIFEIRLLKLLGLMPVITRCASCNGAIKEKTKFSPMLGGLLCAECFLKDNKAFEVLKGAAASMYHISKVGYEQALRLKVSEGIEQNLNKILRMFLDFHLDKSLKSLEFIRKISEHMTYENL
ncbi:MAG: DNA repair protein RecO [Candidatus Omnitrophota bacterium]|nr:DNA repair protein RecO [Candidatus Omnitrophota bacterium]